MARNRLNSRTAIATKSDESRYHEKESAAVQTTTVTKAKKNFVYMDDASIDIFLKCTICSDPFDDPVSTPCGHTFCRECVENAIKCKGDQVCPTCGHRPLSCNSLKPADCIVRNIIDRYLVKCLACGQANIQRGHFEEHLNKLCSKANVPCPAANVRCPWIGPRDQCQGHMNLCLYEQMRPILTELMTTIENQQKQLDIQAVQINKIGKEQLVQVGKIQNELAKAFTQIKEFQRGDSLLSPEHESILNSWIGIHELPYYGDNSEERRSISVDYSDDNECTSSPIDYRDCTDKRKCASNEYIKETKCQQPNTSKELTNLWNRYDNTHKESDTAWTRIYKGSRNGFQPQDFHRTCDGHRKTLVIIRSTQGYLFGGYTNVAWNSICQYTYDSQSFIFTLFNPYNIVPTHYKINFGKESNAIYGDSNCGPRFGYNDICVNSGKQCTFGFPNTYADTTSRGNQTFTGAQTCTIDEIEVYQVKR